MAVLTIASPSASPASADGPRLRFNRLSSDDGLAQNSVENVVQDRLGFLWFGTQEGLSRYDGYGFTTFYTREESGRGSSEITGLTRDPAGHLWVGTVAGLFRLELETGRFQEVATPSPVSLRIADVVTDSEGRVWFTAAGEGLFVVEPAGREPSRARRVETAELGAKASLSALAAGDTGSVWTAEGGALVRVALENGQLRSAVALQGLGSVSALTEDAVGRIWIGRASGELLRYDPKEHQTTRFPQVPEHVLSLWPGKDGRLFVGCRDGGLSVLDPDTGKVVTHRHDPADPSSLSQNDVAAVYEDRYGNLWAGTWNGGVNRLDPYAQAFRTLRRNPHDAGSLPDEQVLAMTEGPDGRLWLGSRNGVLAVGDPWLRRFETVSLELPPETRILALGHYGSDLWVGTTRGLVRLDPASLGRRPLPSGFGSSGLENGRIDAIAVTEGGFWVSSGRSLLHVTAGAGIEAYELPLRGSVSALFAPLDGRLLAASDAGELMVGTRTKDTGRFEFRRVGGSEVERSLAAHGYISSVREDKLGRPWVATRNGAGRIAAADDAVTWLDRSLGLPSEAVSGILVDKNGMLWLGTNRGLSRVDPGSDAMSHFGSVEGAQGTGYAERAVAAGASGLFYFGGKGVTAFDPGAVQLNPHPPDVVFTGLEILRRRMEPRWRDPSSPLERSISATESVTLRPEATVFSVEFAALHYGDSDSIRYRYRLSGFDADWIETDARHRVATYTRLAPGDYVLRVRAVTKAGVESSREARLAIRMLAPWWRRPPALAAWSLLALAVLFGLWKEGRRRTEVKIALAEREAFRQASLTDPLTGLHNRRFLEIFFEHEVARVLRAHDRGSPVHGASDLLFVLVDLDHLKAINDQKSHAAGDRALKGLAEALTREIRGSDLAVRLGGDEFLVVSRFVDEHLAAATVERLREAAERVEVGLAAEAGPSCTVSIGYALFPFLEHAPTALRWERTLEIADRALIMTKRRRRNSYTGLVARAELSIEAVQAFLDGGPEVPVPVGMEVRVPETEASWVPVDSR